MDIECAIGDGVRAFLAKGHIDSHEFFNAVSKQVDEDDPILKQPITHEWTRVVRDFELCQMVYMEAAPGSNGAFRTTWIRLYS